MYYFKRKVGGLTFLTFGRITISWSVTPYDVWARRIEEKMDNETIKALVSIL